MCTVQRRPQAARPFCFGRQAPRWQVSPCRGRGPCLHHALPLGGPLATLLIRIDTGARLRLGQLPVRPAVASATLASVASPWVGAARVTTRCMCTVQRRPQAVRFCFFSGSKHHTG
eukprot:8995538-Alexandrium_andersonii.AAC.1